MNSRKANIAALAAVFALAFLAYFTDELIPAIQVIPLFAFGGLVLLKVCFTTNHFSEASLFRGNGSAFIWLIPWFTLGCSLNSRFENSVPYWIIDTLMLVLARLYTVRVPVADIFEAFFWGAICSLMFFCIATYRALLDVITDFKRLWLLGFHPNTLGYIMSGFVAVMLWKLLCGGKSTRIIAAIGVTLSLTLLFFASSRGSILALGISCFVAVLLYSRQQRKLWIPLLTVVFLGTSFLLLTKVSYFEQTTEYIDNVLQISGGGRGVVGSGLSGRTEIWHDVIAQMSHGSWIYGNGMRSSDALPDSIDNGYIVVIYDMGIIPFLLIIGRVAMLLWRFPDRYSKQGNYADLLLTSLMIIYVLTNFVERLLFGVGNPVSLLMFLIMASPWSRTQMSFAAASKNMVPALDAAR